MKLVFLILAAMAATLIGFAAWQYPDQLFGLLERKHHVAPAPQGQAGAPPQAGSSAPEPAASQQQQVAQQPVEEVHESTDAETPLESVLPRQSIGHAAGLHNAPDPLHLESSAAYVIDTRSKEVLYSKNPDAALPMASITKLMTAMVVLDAKLPLDEPITITDDDVDKERMSRSRMRVGYTLTRREALLLALMSSENRAAHALARTYPAGLAAFIKAMNDKARQLGMAHTVFHDPTGLSTGNQSTAAELTAMALAASAYPLIRDYSTTHEHVASLGNRLLQYRNSDPLVKDPTWEITLQKTGYIVEAGHCVVLRSRMNGQDVVAVLLDASSNGRRSADARRLRDWIVGPTAAAAYRQQSAAALRQQAAVAKATQPRPRSQAAASHGHGRVRATFEANRAHPQRPVAAHRGKARDEKS